MWGEVGNRIGVERCTACIDAKKSDMASFVNALHLVPVEILLSIVAYLPLPSVVSLRAACRKFYSRIDQVPSLGLDAYQESVELGFSARVHLLLECFNIAALRYMVTSGLHQELAHCLQSHRAGMHAKCILVTST
jgi:hypothetical protein